MTFFDCYVVIVFLFLVWQEIRRVKMERSDYKNWSSSSGVSGSDSIIWPCKETSSKIFSSNQHILQKGFDISGDDFDTWICLLRISIHFARARVPCANVCPQFMKWWMWNIHITSILVHIKIFNKCIKTVTRSCIYKQQTQPS